MPTPRPDRSGPRRTCVGCGAVRAQRELVRVVRNADGTLAIGRTLVGRGAWLCLGSPACLAEAIGRGGFARSFRSPVTRAAAEALIPLVPADPGTAPTSPFVPGPS